MSDEKPEIDTDVLIIGGGPGGYAAAIRAGQLDLDVLIVEKAEYGGVCLNHGCIPSKAYVHATDVAYTAKKGEKMGIHADPAVDLSGMEDWKDGIVSQLTRGVEQLCKGNGVTVHNGLATFVDESTAVIDEETGNAVTVHFERAVIATGSRPIELPGFEYDGERVLSSRGLLQRQELPSSLLVVGGGYIGMELSTVFAKLGTDVTVIEMLDDILPGYDESITKIVRKHAESVGIEFSFEETADRWHELRDTIIVTTSDKNGESQEHEVDCVLVAVGREPVTDTVNLDAIGIEPSENGFIPTDHTCQTPVDGIFAVGDVTGEPMLAHAAYAQGHVAAEVLAGEPAALDYQAIPAAVFTDPEIGTVGMSKAEADDAGFDPLVGEMPLRASGRALTLGSTDGFVRIIADSESGFILGGQIVGPDAAELIAEIGLAIEMGAQLDDIAATVHTHPTLSEAVQEAAANALGRAIHTLNR